MLSAWPIQETADKATGKEYRVCGGEELKG